MNRRWKNRGYELVQRNRGGGRSDLTLTLNGEVLFWREYAYDQKLLRDKDTRALCMIGKLRETQYREVAYEPKKTARKQS